MRGDEVAKTQALSPGGVVLVVFGCVGMTIGGLFIYGETQKRGQAHFVRGSIIPAGVFACRGLRTWPGIDNPPANHGSCWHRVTLTRSLPLVAKCACPLFSPRPLFSPFPLNSGASAKRSAPGHATDHFEMRVALAESLSPLEERPFLQLLIGLLQLFLRVHDNGAVPGDWLLERLARDEQEADPFVAGLHHDFVAAVE